MFSDLIKNKRLDLEKIKNVLTQLDDHFIYEIDILNEFKLSVFIYQNGRIDTTLIDKETNDEYTLYKTNAKGNYVAKIRENIADIIKNLVDKYYIDDLFKSEVCIKLLDYIKDTYDVELEFLWKKSDNFVLRENKHKKWFGAFMKIPKNKLGLNSEKMVDVLNVKVDDTSIIDYTYIFPAYHMNKKYWVSILLEDGIDLEKVIKLIDRSYELIQK